MSKPQNSNDSPPTDENAEPAHGDARPQPVGEMSAGEARAHVEKLEGLRERAKTPARRQMLDKRISRLRRQLGRVARV